MHIHTHTHIQIHIKHKIVWVCFCFSEVLHFMNYPSTCLLFAAIPLSFIYVCVCAQSFSHVQLFAIPWTVAHQAVHGISSKDYWSGLPFLSPGYLSNPGINPLPLSLLYWRADSLPLGKPMYAYIIYLYINTMAFQLSNLHIFSKIFLCQKTFAIFAYTFLYEF